MCQSTQLLSGPNGYQRLTCVEWPVPDVLEMSSMTDAHVYVKPNIHGATLHPTFVSWKSHGSCTMYVGQNLNATCCMEIEWLSIRRNLSNATKIATYTAQLYLMKVLDHVMPREKRCGALDSCIGLVGPHQHTIM